MFTSTLRKGFHMTFENGLTASVQWGAGNYCDNHMSLDFSFSKDAKSSTAEVAVWDQERNWLDPQDFIDEEISSDTQVAGYLSAEQVAAFLAKVATAKNVYRS